MSKLDNIEELAFLFEGISEASSEELDDFVSPEGLAELAKVLIAQGVEEEIAKREAASAVRSFCNMYADDKASKESPPTEMRAKLIRSIAATNALLDIYRGLDGGRRLGVVIGRGLARRSFNDDTEAGAGSLVALQRVLETSLRTLEVILLTLPKRRWPKVLRARFVANEAGRFFRLTGLKAMKTRDPTLAHDSIVGMFADYLRVIEAASEGAPLVLSNEDIITGIDLWRRSTEIAPEKEPAN